jgi:hypothetical protein
MKSRLIVVLCVSVFLLLGMGIFLYRTELGVGIMLASRWANRKYSNCKQTLAEFPGMLPDGFYKAVGGAQACATVFGQWVWWLLTVMGNCVYHCCMVAFKIPMMYKRKTQLEMKTSRMWSNAVGITPCTQIVFWMNMDNLVGIATVEDYVYQFLATAIEVVSCFYVLYVPVCMICNHFGIRTTHSKRSIVGHFLFWVWLINQHLQLWQALYDTYTRIKDPKTMADWTVLTLKAKHVKCADLLLGKVH